MDLSNCMSRLFTVMVELLLQSEKPFVLRTSEPKTPESKASPATLDQCKFHIAKLKVDGRPASTATALPCQTVRNMPIVQVPVRNGRCTQPSRPSEQDT